MMKQKVILFTMHAPDKLADELAREGAEVYEALAISEVFALAEEHRDAQIVMTAEVDPQRAKVIQQRYPMVTLKQLSIGQSAVLPCECRARDENAT
jgi:hypothetical protein